MLGTIGTKDGNEMMAFSRAYDTIRQDALQNYTPDLIKKAVEQLNSSNTDKKKEKISAGEAEQYLKSFFKSPPVSEAWAELIQNHSKDHEETCKNAGLSGISVDNSKEQLERVHADAVSAVSKLKFLQEVASIVDASKKKTKGKSKNELNDKENALVDSYSQVIAPSLLQSPAVGANYAKDITREIIEQTKAVLQDKDIMKQIRQMPDLSQIELDTNHVCKAITGKGVGLQA